MIAHLLVQQAGRPDFILFAPHIGRELAGQLAEAKLQFIDLAGNCFVQLGDAYVAHAQGNPAADGGVCHKVDSRSRKLR